MVYIKQPLGCEGVENKNVYLFLHQEILERRGQRPAAGHRRLFEFILK